MARCDYCETRILFGGVKEEGQVFCNEDCHQVGMLLRLSHQIPENVFQDHLMRVHTGLCPRCGKSGPVDVHTAYQIWSALLLTSWKSMPEVSCRPCGVKRQSGAALFSLILGWWGFPWGLLITPVQIARNVARIVKPSQYQAKPSELLERMVRIELAAQWVDQAHAEEESEPA